MQRKKLVDIAYYRANKLNLKNKEYLARVNGFIGSMLNEDLGKKGDITSDSVLKVKKNVTAIIKSKQDGIIAGIEEAKYFLNKNKVKVARSLKDGSKVKKGAIVMKLFGEQKNILRTERVVMNLLQRMSGIATVTNELVRNVKLTVAATRKTPWGILDNKAVSVGGGATHRLGLFESILIKENHLEAIKKEGYSEYIKVGLERAWKNRKRAFFIEVEVQIKEEAMIAAAKFKELNKDKKKPCIIMLDNFKINDIKDIVKDLKLLKLYDYVLMEASGNITPKNIKKYDGTGVDIVSLGFLTHSVKAFDLSMVII